MSDLTPEVIAEGLKLLAAADAADSALLTVEVSGDSRRVMREWHQAITTLHKFLRNHARALLDAADERDRLRDRISALEAELAEARRDGERLEPRVAQWVCSRIGETHMHTKERAIRLLEESVELAQAEGIEFEQVRAQVGHVFNRRPGIPAQEAGGVAVCLLGWCAANGVELRDIATREIERIEAKPVSEIRGSVARKADADLVTCIPAIDAARKGERDA